MSGELAGFDRAVAVVNAAYEAARRAPFPYRLTDPAERKVRGSGLDVASRAGRITALGSALEDLLHERAQLVVEVEARAETVP